MLPVAQATLVDNWDVMGLRVPGSIDYNIDSVFVPEPFTHPALTETPKRGGGLMGLASSASRPCATRGGLAALPAACSTSSAKGFAPEAAVAGRRPRAKPF